MRGILLVALAVSLCAQPRQPAGSVHGTIRDEVSGQPLAGFTVDIRLAMPPGTPQARMVRPEAEVTGYDGAYRVAQIPPGKLTISATDGRLHSESRTTDLNDGADLEINFVIPTPPRISGHVFYDDHQAVAQASVWLIQSQYRGGMVARSRIGPKYTRPDGSFDFDTGLEARRSYYVLVDWPIPDPDGEPKPLEQRTPVETSTYYGDATAIESATAIVLRPGEHRDRADIELRKALPLCVDGKTLIAGKPGAARLRIEPASLAGSGISAVPDYRSAADGSFRVCGLTPGDYAVSVMGGQPRGREDIHIGDSDVHNLEWSVDAAKIYVAITWDGDPAAPNPAGQPSAEPGRVYFLPGNQKGPPVRIILLANSGFSTTLSFGGPTGTFSGTADPGDYGVQVFPPPGSYVKDIKFGGTPITDRRVHLSAGVTSALSIVLAQGGGTLTCQVAGADDSPLPDTPVLVVPDETPASFIPLFASRGLSDGNGAFQASGLAPGKYRALALTRSYRDIPDDIEKIFALLPKADLVDVADKSDVRINVHPVAIQ